VPVPPVPSASAVCVPVPPVPSASAVCVPVPVPPVPAPVPVEPSAVCVPVPVPPVPAPVPRASADATPSLASEIASATPPRSITPLCKSLVQKFSPEASASRSRPFRYMRPTKSALPSAPRLWNSGDRASRSATVSSVTPRFSAAVQNASPALSGSRSNNVS
jgi:hypothetical protein